MKILTTISASKVNSKNGKTEIVCLLQTIKQRTFNQDQEYSKKLIKSGFFDVKISKAEIAKDETHKECVNCGSLDVTITTDSDVCHNCGYIYK